MDFIIPRIDENAKYWLVRTQSGEYYEEFFHGGFIAIGWDEFNNIELFRKAEAQVVTEQIRKTYPDEKRAGHVFRQIYRFINEMSIDDIVLIPSHYSQFISFGKITSDVYVEEVGEDDVMEGACPFGKRRRVNWIKTISRDQLDPLLYKLVYSHHTITDATEEYANIIDRTLHSFYIKGDKAHLVLKVTTKSQVYARDLSRLMDGTVEVIDVFNKITDSDLNPNDIQVKLNVQSPGLIEIISVPSTIAVIGLVLVFIVGGNFTFTHTSESTDVNFQTDGLIEKILKAIALFKKKDPETTSVENKLQESVKRLGIEAPEELRNFTDNLPQED